MRQLMSANFIVRDSIYAKCAYATEILSVRLSVTQVDQSKWLKLVSCNFHHTVAPSL